VSGPAPKRLGAGQENKRASREANLFRCAQPNRVRILNLAVAGTKIEYTNYEKQNRLASPLRRFAGGNYLPPLLRRSSEGTDIANGIVIPTTPRKENHVNFVRSDREGNPAYRPLEVCRLEFGPVVPYLFLRRAMPAPPRFGLAPRSQL